VKYTGAQITPLLRQNFMLDIGRHLYAVLGRYGQLAGFEANHLAQLHLPDHTHLPPAVNLNQALLERLGDDDLKSLVRSEGKRPQAIQRRLNLEFDALLADLLDQRRFQVIKQIELLFAYDLDLDIFRARAANQNHILLLLPGERRGDHITLFAEAEPRFHRSLPFQLVIENHVWELDDAES